MEVMIRADFKQEFLSLEDCRLSGDSQEKIVHENFESIQYRPL